METTKIEKTLESVFKGRINCDKTTFGRFNGKPFTKSLKICGKLGDLRKIAEKFQILSRGIPVRTIEFTSEKVLIDAHDENGYTEFDKNEDVFFDEWMLDRGSYLIYVPEVEGWGKLATQFDPIRIINP